jgi:hypothetical protein
MLIAQIFVYAFYIYLLIGLLFGIWFVFSGVARVDAGMKEAGWKVRLLLLPGSMALWPVLLSKTIKSKKS